MNARENIAEQYISDVLNEKINVCNYVKLAIQRHLNDLKTAIDRGLWFDRAAGLKAIRFFPILIQSKGKQFAGKPFYLQPWEAFIIYSIFGWKRANNLRRYNYAYIEVPKKNGKTTLAAGIGIKGLGFDGESRPEVYTIAKDRGQARICFDEAKAMVLKSPNIRKHLSVWAHSITCEHNGGKIEPLSKESDTKEGMNPYFVINDEYHLQTDNSTYENVKSGMIARMQPLLFTITTAGMRIESPCYEERKSCIDILEGKIEQDNKFAIIYTIDEGDDWKDPEIWKKANPNYGISISPERLEDEFRDAMNTQTKITGFKTKHLCIWTRSHQTWIKDEDWIKCNQGKIDPHFHNGKDCLAALDLASVGDINALALFFPIGMYGIPDLIFHFWIPEKKVIEKADKVNYAAWAEMGYMHIIPGEVIDIEKQAKDIIDITQKYNLLKYNQKEEMYHYFMVDTWKINDRLSQILQNEGIIPTGYSQSYRDMDPAVRELERMILTRGFNHAGNPIMRWMNGNVVISNDSSGNIKIDKKKVLEKVDGMVTLAMVLGGWLKYQHKDKSNPNEIYKNRGLITI